MSVVCSEIIWLCGLLTKLGFSQVHPTPLHADNNSDIQIATNPIYHKLMKHIEVDCHSIWGAFDRKVVSPFHTSPLLYKSRISSPNPRHVRHHHFLVSKLMLVDLPVSICGRMSKEKKNPPTNSH